MSPSIARCELTHLERAPIDYDVARAQHAAYESQLEALGCDVRRLPSASDMPDSVFVEDAAIVLDEIAIITRPGAATRRDEVESIAAALAPFRALEFIRAPGTLDGGDVLLVGKTVYVGRSTRTNQTAMDQLRSVVLPHGYDVIPVSMAGGLHLKSGVTCVGEDTLLVCPDWVDSGVFQGRRLIEVHPDEPAGANALLVGADVVYPSAFPKTKHRLEIHGIRPRTVDASELAKAEGGLTCCSLIFKVD